MASISDELRQELDRLIKDGQVLDLSLLTVAQPQMLEELRTEAEGELRKRGSSGTKTKTTPSKKLVDELVESMIVDFRTAYEPWYSEALEVVKQVLPDRVSDFRSLYKLDRRKDIDFESYTLADYQIGLVITQGWENKPVFNADRAALRKFRQQLNMVKAAQRVLGSRLADIRGVLQADLFDSELDAARELLKNGYLRASGMVAGVVLERHLAGLAAAHGARIRSRAPTISHFNDALKDAGLLDVPRWRFVQRLGDIRNLCGHPKEREPSMEEVQELIDGTDRVTKTFT